MPTAEKKILVLQGGGADGGYQGGAYAPLSESDLEPEWLAGLRHDTRDDLRWRHEHI
jgi:predicted acylesterase/phospholipase RssA